MEKTRKTNTKQSFLALCKELGQRINSTENALLCYRAYQAYLAEHPDTGRGKARKMDRDASCPAFAKKAAEVSGVSRSTINALLQVGRAVQPLSPTIKRTLTSCSLGNWMNGLRKLATKEFDTKRVDVITTFAKQEKADPKSAKANLKKKLGMIPNRREGVVAKMVREPESHYCLPGEHLDVKVGGYLFRVQVDEIAGGRIHLTSMAVRGERKEAEAFFKDKESKPPLQKALKQITPPAKAAA